jgi:ABC-type lipoprotein release transport system permease subunit
MALVLHPPPWLRLSLTKAMLLSFPGVLIGVAASFAAAPLLAEFLYDVKHHDVLPLLLFSSLLVAVTFLASYIPARHATLIDPMETLRHD